MIDSTPEVDSFIVRIVHAAGSDSRPIFRGSVTHIQTSETLNFTDWQEIEAFFRRYLPQSGDLPPLEPPSRET